MNDASIGSASSVAPRRASSWSSPEAARSGGDDVRKRRRARVSRENRDNDDCKRGSVEERDAVVGEAEGAEAVGGGRAFRGGDGVDEE